MALRFPARVKAQTSTTGTGTFSVSEPGGAGYRTFTRAVTDGDLASGDTVGYICVDTTVTNGPNLLEIGSGVWDNTAKTLTRATVYQPNGTAVSFGSGTRDLLVIDNPVLFAILAGANIFTTNQFIQQAYMEWNRAPASNEWLRAERLATEGYLQLSSEVANKEILYISSLYRGSGSPSGETKIAFAVGDATAPTYGPVLRESGAWETAAGLRYVAIAGGNVTKWLWGSAPPTGWTRSNEADDRVIKTAKSTESAGDSGGSWTVSGLSVSGSTDSTVLSVSQIPSHDHSYNTSTGSGGSAVGLKPDGSGFGVGSASSATGGGTGHTHGLSGASIASSAAWRPLYKVWVAATLD